MKPSKSEVLKYGLPGFLFAFTALPLYLSTPIIYEGISNLSLATIGIILMIVRFSDAITDPIVGKMLDKTSKHRFIRWLLPSMLILSVSFFFLINPPNLFSNIYVVIIWFYFFLTVVSISNGAATLAYQSWVVSWTTSSESQINLVTSREMFTLLGVIVASYFATQRMFFEMSIIVLLYSFFSVIALKTLSKNKLVKKKKNINVRFLSVFSKKTRRMFLIFGLNAFANSIPAILFIFFVQDILQLSNNKAGLLLIVYFIFAILSMPFWTRVINSFSPKSTWRFAISLSIFGFIWALFVGTDNFKYFLIICIFTGFALGAELICPPMILATKITQLGHNGALEGSYFGILNLFIKLSLALASGMILPILSYYGYTSSGNSSEFSLTLLQFFYAGFPCILKAFCWFEIRKI